MAHLRSTSYSQRKPGTLCAIEPSHTWESCCFVITLRPSACHSKTVCHSSSQARPSTAHVGTGYRRSRKKWQLMLPLLLSIAAQHEVNMSSSLFYDTSHITMGSRYMHHRVNIRCTVCLAQVDEGDDPDVQCRQQRRPEQRPDVRPAVDDNRRTVLRKHCGQTRS